MERDTSPSCDISSFVERDIDLWLSEELRVNAKFSEWLVVQAFGPSDCLYPAKLSRVSVAGESGETDVEAIFELGSGGTFALLVENKVRHSITADQIARYHARGHHGVSQGKWTAFSVIVFAPRSNLDRYRNVIAENYSVAFEDGAAYLDEFSDDIRIFYRSSFLKRAAQNNKSGSDDFDIFRISFWKSLYQLVDKKYPDYFSLNPSLAPKTAFIAANCKGSPKYFRLDLKGHMGEVDLSFTNKNPSKLLSYLEANMPAKTEVAFNKRSIALRIRGVPKFYVSDGIEVASEAAMQSFDAAYALLEFWKQHRQFFDGHYAA